MFTGRALEEVYNVSMKRLTKPAAAILRDEIESGRVLYTLETHLQLYGSDWTFEPLPAANPTKARPGSHEKVEVMRLRVSLGQSLTHPKDNTRPQDPHKKIPHYVSGLREINVAELNFEP